jgi:hypothetical protein
MKRLIPLFAIASFLRVLEVIYRFKNPHARVFDGQQLDIFITTNIAANSPAGGAE